MEINNNNETGEISPFQDRINLNLFFSGAQRRNTLEEIKNAISNGVDIIAITGEEGTGKTMICRMLEKEIPADFTPIYLPNSLESFDDVARVIALHINTDSLGQPVPTAALVSEIIVSLQENDTRLVLIFDQAERMYLATIERIRKMLDQINIEEKRLQLVFSGRNSFLENLHQLKICDFGEVEEQEFLLNHLGLSETYAYLNHCAQQIAPSRGKSVFTPEVAKKIFNMAQGNLRMTSILAAKTLDAAESNGAVDIVLDRVKDETELQAKVRRKTQKIRREVLRSRLIYGGLGVLTLALLFLVFSGDKEVTEIATESPIQDKEQISLSTTQEAELPSVQEQVSTGNESVPVNPDRVAESEVKEEKTATNERQKETAEITPVQPSESDISDFSDNKVDLVPEEKLDIAVTEPQTVIDILAVKKKKVFALQVSPQVSRGDNGFEDERGEAVVNQQTQMTAGITDDISETPAIQNDEDIVAEKTTVAEPAVAQIELSPLSVQEKKEELEVAAPDETTSFVPTDTEVSPPPQSQVSQNIEMEKGETQQSNQESSKNVVIFAELNKRFPEGTIGTKNPKKIAKIAPVKIKSSGEDGSDDATTQLEQSLELYQERLAAGSNWNSLKGDNLHTVQLMVLTADQAEENLKKRFAEQEYKNIAEDLYIIKNAGSKVFVYFGQYPDLESAKQARNTLPIFLRKHDPYAVSVKDAISKAGSRE